MLKQVVICGIALLLSTAAAGKTEGLDFYSKGQFDKALEELKWEAMNGDRESQVLVGTMYLRGQGTEKDATQAAYYLQEAAKQGDTTAFAYLGELYLAGTGLPQDDNWAMYWTRQAADAGNAAGQVLLGKLYLEGRSVERDPQMALVWFERAAEQGHPEGQYQLAQLLERGEGTRKDSEQALRWYKAAAAQGYKMAGDALQRITGTRPTPPVPTPATPPAPIATKPSTTAPASPPKVNAPPATPVAPTQPTQPERTAPTTQKKRVALLIANQDYRVKSLNLTGPINDARLIEASLLKAGFKVTVKTNLNLIQMNRELSSFLADVDSNTVSLVYYSGHGVEIGGVNYLIPTDFQMAFTLTVAQAVSQSVDIAAFYSRMTAEAEGSLNITVLDACRNNPFKTRGLKGLSNGQGGLKVVSLPGGNSDGSIETFTAYAAESGQVAQDARPGQANGPYAIALAQQIAVPGQELEITFRNVTQQVLSLTGRLQRPAYYSGIESKFIFTPAK